MVVRGVVTKVGGSVVTVDAEEPFEKCFDIDLGDPVNGAGYSVSEGDRVVWWPCIGFRWEEVSHPMSLATVHRLARESDLSPSELEDVERELELERENKRTVEEHDRELLERARGGEDSAE